MIELLHRGAKIGLSICYDLRFPQLYRPPRSGGCRTIEHPLFVQRATGKITGALFAGTRY